ncbi:hypothetical protein CEXT_309371 [Caerostris extrusa]|uniref:Uncharacterized protein n=1 Tax=Caerostris extrusa TaxID=172846 RepID=A0AAV4R7I7_CAEEX|nr:hypothetical protein CEXT_309371 [Caerostris extrusa]
MKSHAVPSRLPPVMSRSGEVTLKSLYAIGNEFKEEIEIKLSGNYLKGYALEEELCLLLLSLKTRKLIFPRYAEIWWAYQSCNYWSSKFNQRCRL